jgi:hypothetical protein
MPLNKKCQLWGIVHVLSPITHNCMNDMNLYRKLYVGFPVVTIDFGSTKTQNRTISFIPKLEQETYL